MIARTVKSIRARHAERIERIAAQDRDAVVTDVLTYARYHRPSSPPLYDQTRDTWGIDPSATATVDEMLRELDLLALPIVTGTLRGPVEGGA
jgi:hypothetical protein